MYHEEKLAELFMEKIISTNDEHMWLFLKQYHEILCQHLLTDCEEQVNIILNKNFDMIYNMATEILDYFSFPRNMYNEFLLAHVASHKKHNHSLIEHFIHSQKDWHTYHKKLGINFHALPQNIAYNNVHICSCLLEHYQIQNDSNPYIFSNLVLNNKHPLFSGKHKPFLLDDMLEDSCYLPVEYLYYCHFVMGYKLRTSTKDSALNISREFEKNGLIPDEKQVENMLSILIKKGIYDHKLEVVQNMDFNACNGEALFHAFRKARYMPSDSSVVATNRSGEIVESNFQAFKSRLEERNIHAGNFWIDNEIKRILNEHSYQQINSSPDSFYEALNKMFLNYDGICHLFKCSTQPLNDYSELIVDNMKNMGECHMSVESEKIFLHYNFMINSLIAERFHGKKHEIINTTINRL